MSNQENLENTKSDNSPPNQDEERKRQFEKMKEKFSKQPSSFGGGKNSGNNFYWIYGLVIVGLLFITFFGTGFSTRPIPVKQAVFEQDMLAKGHVQDINIVNEKNARITIYPDSMVGAGKDQYHDPKNNGQPY